MLFLHNALMLKTVLRLAVKAYGLNTVPFFVDWAVVQLEEEVKRRETEVLRHYHFQREGIDDCLHRTKEAQMWLSSMKQIQEILKVEQKEMFEGEIGSFLKKVQGEK